MADYWKSNDKKFCDFCKCWITDNKPSVAFHENGKRHQANVAKRLSEITRNSVKAEKDRKKMNQEIRKMEDAAMRSYAKDVSRKADLTACTLSAINSKDSTKVGGQVDPLMPPSDFNAEYENDCFNQSKIEVPESSMWVEAKSPEGHTYYWNVKTNESIWKAPKEGFMSIDEYNRINQIAVAQQQLQIQEESKNIQESTIEVIAKHRREQMKVFRKPDPDATAKNQERETYKTVADVAGAPPIGEWQSVVKKVEEKIDLELPKIDYIYIPPVVSDVPYEPPVKKFEEKQIKHLDNDESETNCTTVFKKRKFKHQRNTRQRLDVD